MGADPVAACVQIVDDDPGVRRALAALLTSSGYRVDTFESAEQFLETGCRDDVACVIVDIGLPGMDGIALIGALCQRGAAPPMFVLTGRGNVAAAVSAMRAGAFDFIEKPCSNEELLATLKAAIASSQQAHLPDDLLAAEREGDVGLDSLTPREREVLRDVVAGLPNKMIAHRLGVSPKTVEVHRARVMRKTGARSLPELIRVVLKAESDHRY